MKIQINDTIRDMTTEEISQKEIDTANANAKAQELETAKQAQADLKASAKAKLVAGEPLTEAEADTLVV